MAETTATDEASAKLVEAIREIVAQSGNAPPAPAAAELKPGFWNVLILLLLTANVAFIVYLIPKEKIEGPHWDLLKDAIPVVGGGFFVVVASWYKDWTVRLCQSPIFRVSQIALSAIFCFSIWLPWLPVHVRIDPPEARILVDEGSEELDPSQTIWLSLKPHTFHIKWWEDQGGTGKLFERKLTLIRTLLAAFGGEQPRWAHLYPVHFHCAKKPGSGETVNLSQMEGVSVRIVPDPDSRFDEEFLNKDLFLLRLQRGPSGSLIFTLPATGDPLDSTDLPKGTYSFTPFKRGFKDGPTQQLSVGSPELKVEFEPLQ